MAESKNSHELTTKFNADEIEVAGILCELPDVILLRDLDSDGWFRWGSKRKRSAANNKNQPSPTAAVVPSLPPPEPSSSPEAERRPAKADAASSPATPLSFSPSESDERRKAPRKRKLQKKKEDLLELIEELTESREKLKKEVETVSRYYDKLKYFNLELRARKEELITTGLKKETPHSKVGQSLSQVTELASSSSPEVHHTPLTTDQTVREVGFRKDFHVPSSLSSCGLSLPDLNVSPEEYSFGVECFQPFDLAMVNRNLNRVMASEARRRRIQICRGKTSSIAANKQRFPC